MKVLIIFALVAHFCHAGTIVDGIVDQRKSDLLEEQQSAQYQQQQLQQQQQHHQQSLNNNNNQQQQQLQQPPANYEHGHHVEMGIEPQQQLQQQFQQQRQQHIQSHPQQYVIVRSQTPNQGVGNRVTANHDAHSPVHGEQLQVAHVIEPNHHHHQHQQVPLVEVPEDHQYNPQQIYVQHPNVGAQHILLHSVPQYVPQYVQSSQQQQPQQQHPQPQSQQPQYVQQQQQQQNKPIISVPILRVGQAIQQQHTQIFNQDKIGQQAQQHNIQQIPKSYTQQSVPNIINQQQVQQQGAHQISATLPEVSDVDQPQLYYPQVQPEHHHVHPKKDQQAAQVVSHIIVPIAGQHPTQGIPNHVQVIGQHYQQNAVQQGVSYPNSGQYIVNQQSHLFAYPVNSVRGVDISSNSKEVEHAISSQSHMPQNPTNDGQYITQPAQVVIPYNPNAVAPHHQHVVTSSSDQYVPLQSHQYIQSQQLEHHQQQPQQQQPQQKQAQQQLQQPISHSQSQSSLSSSQQTGSHNGAIKTQGI